MSGRGEALTAERLASARAQAKSALAGCAFCGWPHKDPDTAMHAPVPYVLEVTASEMLELLDAIEHAAAPSVEEMAAALHAADEAMVERVARALCDERGEDWDWTVVHDPMFAAALREVASHAILGVGDGA